MKFPEQRSALMGKMNGGAVFHFAVARPSHCHLIHLPFLPLSLLINHSVHLSLSFPAPSHGRNQHTHSISVIPAAHTEEIQYITVGPRQRHKMDHSVSVEPYSVIGYW